VGLAGWWGGFGCIAVGVCVSRIAALIPPPRQQESGPYSAIFDIGVQIKKVYFLI